MYSDDILVCREGRWKYSYGQDYLCGTCFQDPGGGERCDDFEEGLNCDALLCLNGTWELADSGQAGST
jgi:hypothetical protein